MQNVMPVYGDCYYVGGNDRRIALFESAYPVPRGVSYNSYLVTDERTVLFDTVDRAVTELFLENVAHVLAGRPLDYLVVHHVEPDHSASFARLVETYPSVTVVTSRKAADMLKNFYGFEGNLLVVKEGDTLSVGKRTLRFLLAPMVHWPEVMFTYIPEDGALFSADAFGTFGALGGSLFADECDFFRDGQDDARRYYCNIVGKYGVQVQNVLKKAAGLDLRFVCPLHGPVWRKDFSRFLALYDAWSAYRPEEERAAVFYASVYGHTQNAAEIAAAELARRGVPVCTYDVAVTHSSELLAEAFRCSHLVFASCTYNNGIFPAMEHLLSELEAHAFRNRKYALIQCGSWAPRAGELMEERLRQMAGMEKVGETVTVLSALTAQTADGVRALADGVADDLLKNQKGRI